jgi:hypothetical protein
LPGILTVQAKQNQTITFNALPIKTYGNADFALNATSTNNSIPVTYVSSNPLVATVAGNVVHIVGAGTADIIASQAGSTGYYPASNVTRTLTINKAVVTVSVVDTFRNQGSPNPIFSFNYNGFVLGENSSVLTTLPTVSTLASTNSSVGIYTITPAGAAAANYNFIYVGARLTIYPPNGSSQQYFNAYLSSSNTLSVKFYSPVAALGDIVLYDMLGRPIAIKNVFIPENKFSSAVLNVGHLPNGNYILMVRGKNIDLVKQIAIIRN